MQHHHRIDPSAYRKKNFISSFAKPMAADMVQKLLYHAEIYNLTT